jgi:HSP20 family molecular chaperone IbpA
MKQEHEMKQPADGDAEGSTRPRLSVDRILLLAILVVQLLILWRTVSAPAARTPAESSDVPFDAGMTRAEPDQSIGIVRAEPRRHEPVLMPAPGILFENRMERMMADALQQFEQVERLLSADTPWSALPPSPTMEMRDQDESYVVLFSLPGADPSQIRVMLDGRLLTVASPVGRMDPRIFERRVWLPGPVRTDDYATAVLTNGILRVTVPKETAPATEGHPEGSA